MARRHAKKRRDAEVPVSAFSDIAFLLIIFFILAASLVHVTGIVADRGIAALQRAIEQCGVDDHTCKSAAATHDEFSVPTFGQQELEVSLGTDNTGHFTVGYRRGFLCC